MSGRYVEALMYEDVCEQRDKLEKENQALREDCIFLLGLVSLIDLKSQAAVNKVREIEEKLEEIGGE